jgi:hypothetical protein
MFGDQMLSFISAFALVFQDVVIGDGKDCECGNCMRLREMAGNFDQFITAASGD